MEMKTPGGGAGAWPRLPFGGWRETLATLHMWTQVVGKLRLAQAPHVNHWWQAPLYVTSRGLTTSPVPYGQRTFQKEFVLPYEVVRASADPDAALLQFLQTTYEAAATRARWDRAALER